MSIHERRRQRADRLALRAEQSRGDTDKAWGETFGSGGFFSKDPPKR